MYTSNMSSTLSQLLKGQLSSTLSHLVHHHLKVCHLITPHPVPHLPHEPKNGQLLHTECTLSLSLHTHTHTHNRVKTTSSQMVLVGFKSLAGPHVFLHTLFSLCNQVLCVVLSKLESWGWEVFALARQVVCNLGWSSCICGILHEIQGWLTQTIPVHCMPYVKPEGKGPNIW
jgi:hypothetical protein